MVPFGKSRVSFFQEFWSKYVKCASSLSVEVACLPTSLTCLFRVQMFSELLLLIHRHFQISLYYRHVFLNLALSTRGIANQSNIASLLFNQWFLGDEPFNRMSEQSFTRFYFTPLYFNPVCNVFSTKRVFLWHCLGSINCR